MEKGPIDLYFFPASPPSRAVLLLSRALGVAMNMKVVNIMAGEQMEPDYLKINPMHSVPTLNDNGLVLWESRAILQYLVDQYGKDDSLNPKDPRTAAMVNQQLFFDATTLSARMFAYMMPVMWMGQQPNNENRSKVEEALAVLDKQLATRAWVAGDVITIADFAIISAISTIEAVQIDINSYVNLKRWYEECKKEFAPFGYEEINQKGADMIAGAFRSKLASS